MKFPKKWVSLKCNTKAGGDSVKRELQSYMVNLLELSTVVGIMHEADQGCYQTYGDHINIIHILCHRLCQCYAYYLDLSYFPFRLQILLFFILRTAGLR